LAVGSYASRAIENPVRRTAVRVFGLVDLHSHYRIRPLLRYIEQQSSLNKSAPLRLLEFGCGIGINLFEFAERFPSLTGIGLDIDAKAIGEARELTGKLFPGRLEFRVIDPQQAIPPQECDFVLLMDLLEHVPEPAKILANLAAACHPDKFLISVPTPRYPRVFGSDFVRFLGHVVDGYNLEDLDRMMPPGYHRVHHCWNTGAIASALCAVNYRVFMKLHKQPLAKLRLLPHLFRRMDWFNGSGISCSLFAVYERDKTPA
jgi:2-polyprenyl-3-methyl-5-hydroxy-6-metoxy-1,4-benzoquinol methylase